MRKAHTMNRKRIIGIAAAVAAIGLVSFKLMLNKNAVEAKMYRHDVSQNIMVTAEKIGFGTLDRTASYTGIFEPVREVKILSETQGKVTASGVNEGDRIAQGHRIAKIDDALVLLQREAVEVQIDGMRKDIARYSTLVEAEAIQAVQLEKTETALKAALIQKRTLEEQIARTSVTAPFGGVVTMKMFETGAVLNPGMPLIQLTDITSLKLTISVSEQHILFLRLGQAVTVTADVYPGRTFSGTIVMVGSKGDVSHNYPVHVLIKNSDATPLRAGMYGAVAIAHPSVSPALLVPLTAVVGSQKEAKVYIVENNTAILKDVTLGSASATHVEVLSGIEDGQLAVTGGHINLFNGASVALAK